MIGPSNQLRAILQTHAVGGFDHTPAREHGRLHVAPVPATTRSTVDRIADSQAGQLSRRTIRHQDRRFTPKTITATMTATSVRINGLLEWDVWRVVGVDDLARVLGLERRGDAVGLLLEVPAVIDRRELLQVEAARGVGKCPAPLEGLLADNRATHAGTVNIYSTKSKGHFRAKSPEIPAISRAAGRRGSGRRRLRWP